MYSRLNRMVFSTNHLSLSDGKHYCSDKVFMVPDFHILCSKGFFQNPKPFTTIPTVSETKPGSASFSGAKSSAQPAPGGFRQVHQDVEQKVGHKSNSNEQKHFSEGSKPVEAAIQQTLNTPNPACCVPSLKKDREKIPTKLRTEKFPVDSVTRILQPSPIKDTGDTEIIENTPEKTKKFKLKKQAPNSAKSVQTKRKSTDQLHSPVFKKTKHENPQVTVAASDKENDSDCDLILSDYLGVQRQSVEPERCKLLQSDKGTKPCDSGEPNKIPTSTAKEEIDKAMTSEEAQDDMFDDWGDDNFEEIVETEPPLAAAYNRHKG